MQAKAYTTIRLKRVPSTAVSGEVLNLSIEVGPARDGSDRRQYLNEYMPTKFGSVRRVKTIRRGTRYVHNANAALPQLFVQMVHVSNYSESWVEGVNVYHNPNAIVPLPLAMLSGAAHHFLEVGLIRSDIPEFHPYGSQTVVLRFHDRE